MYIVSNYAFSKHGEVRFLSPDKSSKSSPVLDSSPCQKKFPSEYLEFPSPNSHHSQIPCALNKLKEKYDKLRLKCKNAKSTI